MPARPYSLLMSGIILAISCGTGRAEITHAAPEGFVVEVKTTIKATPQKVYRCLVGNIANWWESNHTYSGDAKNLYLEAEPKGWFGERLPEGGLVQHMEVTCAAPGKSLRLRGALGPLQEHAVTGAMTWTLEPRGESTQLKVVYRVGGFMPGGLTTIATPVDGVVSTQVQRLQSYVETGRAE